jgi:hypothetical protein
MMQTVVWMAYSNSTHFSDPKTYKTLFIPSYGLEDINFARLTCLQDFSEKTENSCGFFSPRGTQPMRLTAGPDATRVAEVALAWTDERGGHLSESKNKKGHLTTAQDKF